METKKQIWEKIEKLHEQWNKQGLTLKHKSIILSKINDLQRKLKNGI